MSEQRNSFLSEIHFGEITKVVPNAENSAQGIIKALQEGEDKQEVVDGLISGLYQETRNWGNFDSMFWILKRSVDDGNTEKAREKIDQIKNHLRIIENDFLPILEIFKKHEAIASQEKREVLNETLELFSQEKRDQIKKELAQYEAQL